MAPRPHLLYYYYFFLKLTGAGRKWLLLWKFWDDGVARMTQFKGTVSGFHTVYLTSWKGGVCVPECRRGLRDVCRRPSSGKRQRCCHCCSTVCRFHTWELWIRIKGAEKKILVKTKKRIGQLQEVRDISKWCFGGKRCFSGSQTGEEPGPGFRSTGNGINLSKLRQHSFPMKSLLLVSLQEAPVFRWTHQILKIIKNASQLYWVRKKLTRQDWLC